MSEQKAGRELKELAYVEETLALIAKTINPQIIIYLKVLFDKAEQIRTGLGLPLESVVGIPQPIGKLAEISSDLQTLPYPQRKVVVIYYTLKFIKRWLILLDKTTNLEGSVIEVFFDRSWYLTMYLYAYRKTSLLKIYPDLEEDLQLTYDNNAKTVRFVYNLYRFLGDAVNDIPHIPVLETYRNENSHYYDYKIPLLYVREIPEEDYRNIIAGMDYFISLMSGAEPKQMMRKPLLALFQELEKLNDLDYLRSPDILSAERMRELGGRIEKIGEISPAMKLHQRLESSGAYAKLDPRRRAMLQTYLSTETPITDLGKLPEVGLKSKPRLIELLHSGMEVAFYNLPQDIQQKYGTPENALRTRTVQQTQTKSERLKQSHSRRKKNSDTGKIEFSDTHHAHIKEGATRRWQRYREQNTQAEAVSLPEQP